MDLTKLFYPPEMTPQLNWFRHCGLRLSSGKTYSFNIVEMFPDVPIKNYKGVDVNFIYNLPTYKKEVGYICEIGECRRAAKMLEQDTDNLQKMVLRTDLDKEHHLIAIQNCKSSVLSSSEQLEMYVNAVSDENPHPISYKKGEDIYFRGIEMNKNNENDSSSFQFKGVNGESYCKTTFFSLNFKNSEKNVVILSSYNNLQIVGDWVCETWTLNDCDCDYDITTNYLRITEEEYNRAYELSQATF